VEPAQLRAARRVEQPPAHDVSRARAQSEHRARTRKRGHKRRGTLMAEPQQPLQAPPEAGSMTAAHRELLARTPDVIAPGHTFGSVTDKISGIVLTHRTPLGWFVGFAVAFIFLMILNVTIAKLLFTGIGIWGNNIPVGWAFDIINFVWWIGIGHAGTLISAILPSRNSRSESSACSRSAGADRRSTGSATRPSTCCWPVCRRRSSSPSTPS